jgi:hypothetical protein
MSFEKLISFKRFMLINENETLSDIASKINDKLNAVKNIATMGVSIAETDLKNIINDIKEILHGSWIGQNDKLMVLQRVGVNLSDLLNGNDSGKTDDKNVDIIGIINKCLETIDSGIIKKSTKPLNSLAVDKKEIPSDEKDDTITAEPAETSDTLGNTGNMQPSMEKSSIPPLGAPTDEARPNS